MPLYRYNTLNVFTDDGRGGNPLAVFVQASGLTDAAMQQIAADLNLSETVFVWPAREGGHARVRIFTPSDEINFAGHPLLGTGWILGGHLVIPRLRLETGAGMVEVELERLGDPLHRARVLGPRAAPVDRESAWVPSALGLAPARASTLPVTTYRCGMDHCLVEVESPEVLARLEPDMARLAAFTGGGVYAFARADQIYVRYFAPSFGVPEDPGTGSAALALGHFLADQQAWPADEAIRISQTTRAGRHSCLELTRAPVENGSWRIAVGGSAVVTGRGERLFGPL